MNLAVALEPYRHDTIFSQSPEQVDSPWEKR
jgi:CRISPR-associated protein Cst2